MALVGQALVGLALLSGGRASADDSRTLSPQDRDLYDTRVDQIPLWTERHDTATGVVVLTSSCAFRSNTRRITRRNVNRIGITQDIPVLGRLFGNTPRQGQLNSGNQVGIAYLDRRTLLVDLRYSSSLANPDRGLLDKLAAPPSSAENAPFAMAPTTPPFASFSVVNRNFEFVIPTASFTAFAPGDRHCAPGALDHLPSLAPLFPRPIGTAHLLTQRLILLVPPSIIAGD